ncbi:MAG: CRTAC1 family protein [Armatimonadota bacterium]
MIYRPLVPALLVLSGLLFTQPGCRPASTAQAKPAADDRAPAFQDVTAQAGIAFRHDNGGFGKKLFPEIMGSGGAFLDADQDGWLDLYLVNSETLPGASSPRRPVSRFYRNRRDGTFEDQTERSGLGRVGYGMGAAVGDVNNDGYPDLYVTALGPDRLFLNRGDGTFEEISKKAGLGDPRFGSSATFLDYDRDGDQDLYVCNYVQLPDPIEKIACRNPAGGLQYCDVHLYGGDRDRLYRNNGDLTFTDVSGPSGITRRSYRGLAVLTSDYDRDGWVDIFVANDENPLLLWRNNGDGTFTDVAGESGVAYDGTGRVVAGMGLDMADLNRDGHPELYETGFQGEPNILFQMESDGWFVDRTQKWGLGSATMSRLGFGLGFLDFDQDGWRDLVIANGHVIDDVQQFQPSVSYAQTAQLFRNTGAGFQDVSPRLGDYAAQQRVGRGAILGDYDNDGDVDVLFTNNNQAPALLRNLISEEQGPNHWISIRCEGTTSARDAYGSVVELAAGGVSQKLEVRASAGYLGSNDPRVNFGLGRSDRVDRILVTWPDGKSEEFGGTSANQHVMLRQGSGRIVPDRRDR